MSLQMSTRGRYGVRLMVALALKYGAGITLLREVAEREGISEKYLGQIVLRDQDKAEKILNRLKKGEEFGKVAREVSIGPEASNGGDLGFVSRGVMPEAIDAVIFSLPRGAISHVIRSPYGYHICRIIEKEDRGKFPDIREKVILDIRKQKEEQAYVLWLSGLRSRAVIKIDSAILKTGTVPDGRQKQ